MPSSVSHMPLWRPGNLQECQFICVVAPYLVSCISHLLISFTSLSEVSICYLWPPNLHFSQPTAPKIQQNPSPPPKECIFTPMTTPFVQSPTLKLWPPLSSNIQCVFKLMVLILVSSHLHQAFSIPAAITKIPTLNNSPFPVCQGLPGILLIKWYCPYPHLSSSLCIY